MATNHDNANGVYDVKAFEFIRFFDSINHKPTQIQLTRKLEAYNGNIVYVFDHSSTVTMPTTANTTYSPAVQAGGVIYVPASSQTQINGGQTYVLSCSTFFTINKDSGVIENVRFEGNNCKS